jgi:hypothetical protein
MSLIDLVDNTRTDKNTSHSYLTTYDTLFSSRKDLAKNVLEIGIDNGGSIKLWADYFKNATIQAIDIIPESKVWDELKNKDNIILHPSTDAYDVRLFTSKFLNPGTKFDIIIDDGPHTLESMVIFLNMYIHLLTDDGLLIIEDIQSPEWINILIRMVPPELRQFMGVYDLRKNKGRYDDILFIVDKRMS